MTAGHLLEGLRRAASVSELAAPVLVRLRQIEPMRAAADAYLHALETLKTSPDSNSANLAAGQFLCVVKNDWKRGLPMIVKGGNSDDSELSRVAAIDLAGADDPRKQVEVGNAWSNLAKKGGANYERAMRARAAFWYGRAWPRLSGLEKLAAQKMAEENASQITFDFKNESELKSWNVVDGHWTMVNNGLLSQHTEAWLEYNSPRPIASVILTFTPHDATYFWLLIGTGRFRFHIQEHYFGVLPPDFDRSPQPELWRTSPYDFDHDTRYTARFQVLNDGTPVVEFKGITLAADKFRAVGSGTIHIVAPAGLIVQSVTVVWK